jgi:hypothetical protein
MSKKNHVDVRDHSQEKEWLKQLGQGNLVNGVDQLLQQMADSKNASDYLKDYKSGWRRK